MPISKPDYALPRQLALELDLPEDEIRQGEVILSTDEVQRRSETARLALNSLRGQPGAPGWLSDYWQLIEGGWPWRVAAFIAWASSPRKDRRPATQDELATKHLGLTSDRAISTWCKRNPAIIEMIALLQAAPLFQHRADAFDSLVKGMLQSGGDYKFFNHLKLFMEMSGDYVPTSKLSAELRKKLGGDLSELSDDELAALAGELENVKNKSPQKTPGDTEGDDDGE